MADLLADEPTYPGGSKSRVTKAGAAVRNGTETDEDLACIDLWRAAHAPVINTFQALLRGRAKRSGVIVGQRHKRKLTIFGKLRRLPKMELARMDDIAGCRLIFENAEALYSFRTKLHAAKFNHKMRNIPDKYDYIKAPKRSGYRGIHDIYEYNVNSQHGSKLKGLFIELQYRTEVQHAWATTVEIIGLITSSQPKFQEGDTRFEAIMSYASEILARAWESSKSCHPDLDNKDLVTKFLDLDSELGLLPLLRALNSTEKGIGTQRNFILLLKEGKALEVKAFRYTEDALKALFKLESENPGIDVVLVKGDSTEDVRVAFKNYFSDAREFIRLIEQGCEKLSGRKVMRVAPTRRTSKKPKSH